MPNVLAVRDQQIPNMLNISDVFKPDTAEQVLRTAYLKDQMDEAKIRNRLLAMEQEEKKSEQNFLVKYGYAPQLQPGPGTKNAMTAGGGSPGGAGQIPRPQNIGEMRAFQTIQDMQQKRAKGAADLQKEQAEEQRKGMESEQKTMKFIQERDPKLAMEYWNQSPLLSKIGQISFSGEDAKEVSITDPQGNKKLLGYNVKKPDGTWTFEKAAKDPASTEGNYLQGLEAQLRQAHPDWPAAKIQFEAAKQVREENIKAQKDKIQFGVTVKSDAKGGGAEPLTQGSAEMEGAKYLLTGKLPFTGMSGKGRTAMINEGTKIAKEHGWTPNQILRMQADYRSMDKSVSKQRQNYDMMNGFVINMDKQMNRLEEVYKKLPRSQTRLLNIPIVSLRQKALGTGEEAQAAALLIELGNESGKLSTNSASSVRELSEGAQKQWAKIHDNLLSYNELKKVLTTTKQLGHDRLQSTKDAMDFTLQGIESLGGAGPAPANPVNPVPAPGKIEPRKPGESIADYLRRTGGQ